MVAGYLLHYSVPVQLEEDEVADIVQEEVGPEKAADDGFQLELEQRAVVLVLDGAPGEKPLRRSGERAHAGIGAVADDQRFVKDEQVLNLVLVCL